MFAPICPKNRLQLVKNCKKLQKTGLFRSGLVAPISGTLATGCGCSCLIWRPKNRTGPDLETLTKPISTPAASQRLAALEQLQVPPSPSACQQLLKGWLPGEDCKSHQAHQHASSCSKAGCLGTIAGLTNFINVSTVAQGLAASLIMHGPVGKVLAH